jgi:hypothetical protein
MQDQQAANVSQDYFKHQLKQADQLLDKVEQDKLDYTEQLGDLTLRQIKSNKEKKLKWYVFYPDSTFKTAWDFIALLIIIYEAIVIPYRFSFRARAFGTWMFFEYLMDIFFMADLGKTSRSQLY